MYGEGPIENLGPFRQAVTRVIAEAPVEFGSSNGLVPGPGDRTDDAPKHAPGFGWRRADDVIGKPWMRSTNRAYMEVWWPEHDAIIEIGKVVGLPSQPEYQDPDLCGTPELHQLSARKQKQYADTNERAAASGRYTPAQAAGIRRISGLQRRLERYHRQIFSGMVGGYR